MVIGRNIAGDGGTGKPCNASAPVRRHIALRIGDQRYGPALVGAYVGVVQVYHRESQSLHDLVNEL